MSLDFYLHYECVGNDVRVFNANITHNLNEMAMQANIYECLWRPDEHGMIYAKDIVKYLEKGLVELKAKPEFFEKFNAPNGWGMYEHFIPFVQEVLDACRKYPNAIITVSR